MNILNDNDLEKYHGRYDEVPNIFSLMDPMPGALDAFKLFIPSGSSQE